MRPKPYIEESRQDSLKKIVFSRESNQCYYTVSFYDEEDNSVNICASTQIGCVEKCSFCATADHPFIGNLTVNEMVEQYKLGVNCLEDYRKEKNSRLLYIILEGMGEPSYNINNCLSAFSRVHPDLSEDFDRMVFRVSTIGNPKLISPYKKYIQNNSKILSNVQYQFQLSLHTPLDREREILIPIISRKHRIKEIFSSFYDLSDFFGLKLKCNYLLLNFPWGENNYSYEHLDELVRIIEPEKTRIKLTQYSETDKGFSSPDLVIYEQVKEFLESHGIQTKIRRLLGNDLNAACGMLHYENV